MKEEKEQIEFNFEDGVSKKGKALKYINFIDKSFRLTAEQKNILKNICKGYFFYSKSKQMWGFTHRGNNEVYVFNYIKYATIPEEIKNQEISNNGRIRKESIPFKIEDFEINFVELPGRPFFFHQNQNGIIEININLNHWFFVKKDISEKEIAKKIVLSLVGTELEFTSQLIENYFIKLNRVQENMKYTYGKNK